MAEKLDLPDIGTLGNPITARGAINTNFTAIENAFDNTLSRDGTTPNQMEADIDLNGNDLLNVRRIDADELYKNGVPFEQAIAYADKQYQIFSGTGAQVDFPLSQDPASLGNLEVSVAGVVKRPGIDYSYAGTTLHFTAAPAAGASNILVRFDRALPTGVTTAGSVLYADPVCPTVAKTIEDKLDLEPVSILQAIDPSKHAAVMAGTNTDDHAAAINALITSMIATGRYHLHFDVGTIYIGSSIVVPADFMLTGSGIHSVFKPCAAITSMVNMTGNYAQVRDINFQNASSLATRGVSVTSPFFAKVLDNYFGTFHTGIYCDGIQEAWIERNHALNCSFGVFSNNDGRGCRFMGNHVQGGTGIWLGKTTQQPEGVRIISNELLPTITADPNSGHGIVITAGLEMQIMANMCGNVDKNGILLVAVGGNAIAAVKVAHNWIDNDNGVAGSEGIFVYGNVSDVTLLDNTCAHANGRGIHIGLAAEVAPQRIDLVHNKFFVNVSGDMQIEKGVDLRITGHHFVHATSNLREEVNTITSRVYANTFIAAPLKSTGSRYYDNDGPSGSNTDNGMYTPTLANVANTSARSPLSTSYSRVGDTVHVAGRVDVTPTAAATLTQISMSLPVPTNLALNGDLGGSASFLGASSILPATISGDTAGELAVFSFYSTGTTSIPGFFSFSYRVQ